VKQRFYPLLVIFLVSVPTGLSFAQEIEDPTRCFHCKTTGKIPNPFHDSKKIIEQEIAFCSWRIEADPEGFGLPWIPCQRCKNPSLQARAQKEFDRKAKIQTEWLKKRRTVDETLRVKAPLFHVETEHFAWAWSIPKLTYKKKKYRQQDALHLYAKRMEAFYADFQRVHKIRDTDNLNNKHNLFCFEREMIAMRACGAYGKQPSPSGRVTLQGEDSVYVCWWDKVRMPNEDNLFRNLIHNVTHLMTAVYGNLHWLYESGIAYEGIGHWWEIYYYDKATSSCFRELDSLSDWVSTKWEARVKKSVLVKKQPSLTSMLDKNGGSLDCEEHLYAWSYIDCMMHWDPKKTLDFFVVLKEKRPARDAFLEVWGCSPLGFEEKWIAFVREEYSIK